MTHPTPVAVEMELDTFLPGPLRDCQASCISNQLSTSIARGAFKHLHYAGHSLLSELANMSTKPNLVFSASLHGFQLSPDWYSCW